MSLDPTLIGYSAAAIAYLLLAIALMVVWRGRYEGSYLIVATLTTSAWSFVLVYSTNAENFSSVLVFICEIASDIGWLIFLSSMLAGANIAGRAWVTRYAGVALAAVIMILGLLADISPAVQAAGIRPGGVLIFGSILTSLYALVSLEQIYRNARRNQIGELKHLCLGLAGIFGVDLFLYSNAIFIGEIGTALWAARGFVVAMCAPLIAISIHRRQSDGRALFVSRKVIFYTTTLVAAGLYLTLIGVVGYLVRDVGLEWIAVAQIAIVAGAMLTLAALVMSERLRARVHIFVTKHIFASKYDYREEWLKLIQTLTGSDLALPLRKRAIQALAQIVGSPSGTLWLVNADQQVCAPVTAWNMRPANASFDNDGPFLSFVRETGWVIDVDEMRENPHRFGLITASLLPDQIEQIKVIVPLIHESTLVGLIGLSWGKTPLNLNFEDYDFLKLVGKQIAGYLVQEAATERLAESRQFEAFNRLTAFVMHDLKNAIAQQMLVVKNAEKHRRNPEFVDDAIKTIKGSVARMQKVVTQLQQGIKKQHADHIDVGKLILQAVSASEDRQPIPVVRLCDARIFVLADGERLLMALCHAIRNAQDATPTNGRIEIDLSVTDGWCSIRITDSGQGMDAEFVRDRLFKPFDTTKGAQGMGIGAYQIREAVRSAGGMVRVESAPGEGTVLCLTLPLAA